MIPEVFDHDQGTNGTFKLFLEGDGGIFEVTPKMGINEATFMIRVKDQKRLDFEKHKMFNFSIVAQEMADKLHLAVASVTIHVRDQNDNPPQFLSDKYTVSIPENIKPGSTIAKIKADDKDSGYYGTEGIRYTSLTGPISKALILNNLTGEVTMGNWSNLIWT